MHEEARVSQALTDAQATIARQTAELEELRRQVSNGRLVAELKAAIDLAAITRAVAEPVRDTQLLDLIVETAAQMIDAQAASLLLVDDEARELVFEVTLGQKASDVKKLRVPLGHGIAGLVAVTGQPMATSSGQHDARQAADIAERVGYVPSSILCMPLMRQDNVVGVLELLDKRDAPSFTPADMQALALFANQAAVAIEQSQTQQNLSSLVADALLSIAGSDSSKQRAVWRERAQPVVTDVEQDADFRWAQEIARLIQELARHGEAERRAAERVLRAFVDLARAQSAMHAVGDDFAGER